MHVAKSSSSLVSLAQGAWKTLLLFRSNFSGYQKYSALNNDGVPPLQVLVFIILTSTTKMITMMQMMMMMMLCWRWWMWWWTCQPSTLFAILLTRPAGIVTTPLRHCHEIDWKPWNILKFNAEQGKSLSRDSDLPLNAEMFHAKRFQQKQIPSFAFQISFAIGFWLTPQV